MKMRNPNERDPIDNALKITEPRARNIARHCGARTRREIAVAMCAISHSRPTPASAVRHRHPAPHAKCRGATTSTCDNQHISAYAFSEAFPPLSAVRPRIVGDCARKAGRASRLANSLAGAGKPMFDFGAPPRLLHAAEPLNPLSFHARISLVC